MKTCQQCDQPISARGLCKSHYTQNYYRGTLDAFPMLRSHQDPLDRLEHRSERIPWTGCRIWMGAVDLKGYGSINFSGRPHRVHRLAYELAFGPIPSGLLVCHRCDTPPCCEPTHLFLGTPRDNMRDMHAKGRGADLACENSGRAILTAEQVLAVRGDPRSQRAIAQAYKVSRGCIAAIKLRVNWRALD